MTSYTAFDKGSLLEIKFSYLRSHLDDIYSKAWYLHPYFALIISKNDISVQVCCRLVNIVIHDNVRQDSKPNNNFIQHIKSCDILIPLWVVAVFGYQPDRDSIKSIIYIDPTRGESITNQVDSSIHLLFLGFFSLMSPDESHHLYKLPQQIIKRWPCNNNKQTITDDTHNKSSKTHSNAFNSFLKPSSFEKLLPSLLHGSVLCNETCIVINALDTIMIFKISIVHKYASIQDGNLSHDLFSVTTEDEIKSELECLLYKVSLSIPLHLTVLASLSTTVTKNHSARTDFSMVTANDLDSSSIDAEAAVSQTPTSSTSTSICDIGNIQKKIINIIKCNHFIGCGPRSVLLTGPAGCGKSYALNSVRARLNASTSTLPTSVVLPWLTLSFLFSAKNCNIQTNATRTTEDRLLQLKLSKYTDTSSSFSGESSSSSSSIGLLIQLMDMFVLDELSKKAMIQLKSLVLLCDNNNPRYSHSATASAYSAGTGSGTGNHRASVIVLIDDVEELLFSPMFDSRDAMSDMSVARSSAALLTAEHTLHYSEASLVLRRLLTSLANENSNTSSSSPSLSVSLSPSLIITVIGTTQVSMNKLPQHHTGAPSFEKVIIMPRARTTERELLIYLQLNDWCRKLLCRFEKVKVDTYLSDVTSGSINSTNGGTVDNKTEVPSSQQEQQQLMMTIMNEQRSIMMDWSSRIAGMTRGYLPTDLIDGVLAQAYALHQQQQQQQQQQRQRHDNHAETLINTDTQLNTSHTHQQYNYQQYQQSNQQCVPAAVMRWRVMLTAVARSSPASLRGLRVNTQQHSDDTNTDYDFEGIEILNSDSSSNNKSRSSISKKRWLSWSSFGGYKAGISRLKKLLSRIEKSLQHNTAVIISTPSAITTLDGASSGSGTGIGTGSIDVRSCHSKSHQSLAGSTSLSTGVVLHGPSGCGKTFLASIIAAEANMNFISVRSTELLSKYFGETESTVRELFSRARACAPCVLFFDDFDSIACTRAGSGGSGGDATKEMASRVLSTFLNELDGMSNTSSASSTAATATSADDVLMVVIACASLSQLDPALLRPGRLHCHIELSAPSRDDIADIFQVNLNQMQSIISSPSPSSLLLSPPPPPPPPPAAAAAIVHTAEVNDKDKSHTISGQLLTELLLSTQKNNSNNHNTATTDVAGLIDASEYPHTRRYTGADVTGICQRAKQMAVRDAVYHSMHTTTHTHKNSSSGRYGSGMKISNVISGLDQSSLKDSVTVTDSSIPSVSSSDQLTNLIQLHHFTKAISEKCTAAVKTIV